ncbi:hypothetical protein [Paracoccus ravus]|uniref:hypothetical protein n=1 Tax=Paracoccus ravus TaxID=2447760 RepID=UPI00106E4950|nr:hypothetical protein [Paracoccus ravus]
MMTFQERYDFAKEVVLALVPTIKAAGREQGFEIGRALAVIEMDRAALKLHGGAYWRAPILDEGPNSLDAEIRGLAESDTPVLLVTADDRGLPVKRLAVLRGGHSLADLPDAKHAGEGPLIFET